MKNVQFMLSLGAALALGTLAACGSASGDGGSGGSGGSSGSSGTGGNAGSGGNPACPVPATWSAPDWTASAAEALNLRAQLDALAGNSGIMRTWETNPGAASLNKDDLIDKFEEGALSLADVTTDEFTVVLGSSLDEFVAVITAGNQPLVDVSGGPAQWDPGAAGGVFEGRGINEGGLELRQIVDKGLFAGGALYAHAVNLTEGTIDAATIDALAALWGTSEHLAPAPTGSLTDSASYGYQMGFFAEGEAALRAAKAHAQDSECTAERDAALVSFFRNWELSMMARMVFYANEAAVGVAAQQPSLTDLASALHELAEGVGLAVGFHGLPNPATGPLSAGARVITDAKIEEILGALGVNLADLGASTTGTLFVNTPGDAADAVVDVEAVIMDVYDVDAAAIASYRSPTAG